MSRLFFAWDGAGCFWCEHALLRQCDGKYLLSPAFDMVPLAQGLGCQAIEVGDRGTEASLENALTRASSYGLKKDAARDIAREVAGVVDGWQDHFRGLGVRDVDLAILSQYIEGENLRAQRRDTRA